MRVHIIFLIVLSLAANLFAVRVYTGDTYFNTPYDKVEEELEIGENGNGTASLTITSGSLFTAGTNSVKLGGTDCRGILYINGGRVTAYDIDIYDGQVVLSDFGELVLYGGDVTEKINDLIALNKIVDSSGRKVTAYYNGNVTWVKYYHPGDLDKNGYATIHDYWILLEDWLQSSDSPVGNESESLYIDFSKVGGPVEPGYQVFEVADNNVESLLNSYSAFGTTITVNLPALVPKHRSIQRGTTDNGYSGESGALLQDWIAADYRSANEPLKISLSNLPAGIYTWTSYHHDMSDQTGMFDVTVTDAIGATAREGRDLSNSGIPDNVDLFIATSRFKTFLVCDGTNDVTLESDASLYYTGTASTAFALINGFDLEYLRGSSLEADSQGIDFTKPGGSVESGYLPFTIDDNATTNLVNNYAMFGKTVKVNVELPINLRSIERGTTANGYSGESGSLIKDWVGADYRGSLTAPLTTTLSGLPAGAYKWTSFHHDNDNQSGVFDAVVTDSNGTVATTAVDITNSDLPDDIDMFAGISKLTTTIVSDGSSDVTFDFNGSAYYTDNDSAFFAMNGFKLNPVKGDINNDGTVDSNDFAIFSDYYKDTSWQAWNASCMTDGTGLYETPEADIRHRFRLYENMGINMLRVTTGWSRLEKQEGVLDDSTVRPYLDMVKDRSNTFKVKMIPGTIMASTDWYRIAHPDMRFRSELGYYTTYQCMSYWYVNLHSILSEKASLVFNHMANDLQIMDQVDSVAVDLGPAGEPIYPVPWMLGSSYTGGYVFWFYSQNAFDSFSNKMQEKYADIAVANSTWSTSFASWNDVIIYQPGVKPGPYWNDVLTWYRDSKRDFIKWQVQNYKDQLAVYAPGRDIKLIIYVPGSAYTDADWASAVATGNGAPSIKMMSDSRFLVELAQEEGLVLQYTGFENTSQCDYLRKFMDANGIFIPIYGENAGSQGEYPLELADNVLNYHFSGIDYTHASNLFEADQVTPRQNLYDLIKACLRLNFTKDRYMSF